MVPFFSSRVNPWFPSFALKPVEFPGSVLVSFENNAENNQLQLDRCRIIHASTLQGTKQKAIFYRAQGRSSPKVREFVHIELIAEVAES